MYGAPTSLFRGLCHLGPPSPPPMHMAVTSFTCFGLISNLYRLTLFLGTGISPSQHRSLDFNDQYVITMCSFGSIRSREKCNLSAQLPPPCTDIERVSTMKVLGVIINDQLRATDHVNTLLSSCSSLLFALRVLRSRGIPSVTARRVPINGSGEDNVLYASMVWYLHGCRSCET